MTCRGGVTTSPGHRPKPTWCRTARARCLTTARRPPSTCSCRGTPREPARRPRTPGPAGPGQARRPRVTAPISHPRRTRRAAHRLIRPPAAGRSRRRARVRRRRRSLPGDRRGSLPWDRLSAVPRQRRPVVSGHWPCVVSGPARAVPGLDPAQHTRSSRRPDRARTGHPGRAGHSDDAGGLAPARSGLRPALGASRRDRALPGPDGSAPDPGAAEPDGNGELNGLPRRVRQASLAPQLRDNPPQRRTTVASAGSASGTAGPTGPTGPAGPSPAEIRQNMSALQRGWQEGRAQRMAHPVSGSSGPGPSSGGGDDDSSTDEEARGNSDGS